MASSTKWSSPWRPSTPANRTDPTPEVHIKARIAEFKPRPLGPHLNDILQDYIAESVPVLKIGRDRMEFYPGSAFSDLVPNARPQVWRATPLAKASGPVWFSIFLDAIGLWWTVEYVAWEDGFAFVSTGRERFYWKDGLRGLSHQVLRPLFIDWMLELALISQFGPDFHREVAADPVLFAELNDHQHDIAGTYKTFTIEKVSALRP